MCMDYFAVVHEMSNSRSEGYILYYIECLIFTMKSLWQVTCYFCNSLLKL
jgi:hypothetical protein